MTNYAFNVPTSGVRYYFGKRHETVAYNRFTDRPGYCPYCQTYAFHFIGCLDMVGNGNDAMHFWIFRCVNPHCKRVFTKILHGMAEKVTIYRSKWFPMEDGYKYYKMGKLKPPVKDAIDDLYSEPKLEAGIEATTGYLSPDGVYYPCRTKLDYGAQVAVSYNHDGYARAILYHLLNVPHEILEEMSISNVQYELIRRGWIRLDGDGIYPDDVTKYTDRQADSLMQIVAITPQSADSINRARITEVLANRALKNLEA